MQHIPYIPKYTSNQPFKNDFTQSFSLAFIIRKNALILYSFSEEKEVQNGLFYHFIYKTLVVNWSNMLHRKITVTRQKCTGTIRLSSFSAAIFGVSRHFSEI